MGRNVKILGIDPGDTASGWVVYSDRRVLQCDKTENYKLRAMILAGEILKTDILMIEMIQGMGMAVGQNIFDTCVWVGRFIEVYAGKHQCITRTQVKQHLCGHNTAKDANIRQAIMDRYGSTRQRAIGKKKTPGPLYSVKRDMWSALAVAITGDETHVKVK